MTICLSAMPGKISDLTCRRQNRHVLEDLVRQVMDAHRGKQAGSSDCLAVIGLIAGMPLSEWQALSDKYGLGDWLALPLNGEADRARERRVDADPIAPDMGYFEYQADAELAGAAAAGLSVSLAMLSDLCEPDPERLERIIQGNLRPNEFMGRIGPGLAALLLPGVGLNGAKARLENLKASLSADKSCPPDFKAALTCSLGRVKITSRELIELTIRGLERFKATSNNWIIVCELPRETEAIKATMVRSDEKRFLFAGAK